MLRAEPIWLKAEENAATDKLSGLYSTRVVMAESEMQARASAMALVREAVEGIVANPKDVPVSFDVEESSELYGIVWHQPRGFSFYMDK
jgi:hypothetical protein